MATRLQEASPSEARRNRRTGKRNQPRGRSEPDGRRARADSKSRSHTGGANRGRPDPNHHLWRNGRLWWVAFTVIHEGWRQERVRVSLQTDDVEVARRRRDDLLSLVEEAKACEVSLRFAPRRSQGHDAPAPARERVRQHR